MSSTNCNIVLIKSGLGGKSLLELPCTADVAPGLGLLTGDPPPMDEELLRGEGTLLLLVDNVIRLGSYLLLERLLNVL